MDPRRAELIRSHLHLVEQTVARTAARFPAFVDRSELHAAGTLGLVEAALRYDFERHVAFATFATPRIRGAVLDVARSVDWVSRSTRQLERRADSVSQELATANGSAPTDRQLAERLGVTVTEIVRMRRAVENGISSAAKVPESHRAHDGGEPEDRSSQSPEEVLEQRDLLGYLRAALAALPERLRIIITGIYLEDRSQEELAELLGVSSSRISQLHGAAIGIIRDGIESQFTPRAPAQPRGRVEIRRARFASAVANHADLLTRLSWSDPTAATPQRTLASCS